MAATLALDRALVLLLSLVALAGCGMGDPWTPTFTSSKPADADLVGTYVLDERSRELVTEVGHYKSAAATITLGEKGEVVFADVPDWWYTDSDKPGGKHDTASGKWSVARKQDDWWEVTCSFPAKSLPTPTGGSRNASVVVAGEKPPYVLHITIGDPDEGRAMRFERSKSTVTPK